MYLGEPFAISRCFKFIFDGFKTQPFGSIRCILDNCSYNPKRVCENSWHFLSNLLCHDIWSKHAISNMGWIIYSSSNFMLETGLCYPNYLSDFMPPVHHYHNYHPHHHHHNHHRHQDDNNHNSSVSPLKCAIMAGIPVHPSPGSQFTLHSSHYTLYTIPTTQFQIEGGGLVQGVTKLIRTFSILGTENQKQFSWQKMWLIHHI